jgi:hypothetical protein
MVTAPAFMQHKAPTPTKLLPTEVEVPVLAAPAEDVAPKTEAAPALVDCPAVALLVELEVEANAVCTDRNVPAIAAAITTKVIPNVLFILKCYNMVAIIRLRKIVFFVCTKFIVICCVLLSHLY